MNAHFENDFLVVRRIRKNKTRGKVEDGKLLYNNYYLRSGRILEDAVTALSRPILRCEAPIRARGKNAIVRDAKPASRRRRILSCVSVASRRHYSPSLAEGRRRDFNYADESASFLRSLASLNGAARDTHVPEMPLLVVCGKKQAGGNEDEQIAAFIGPCLSTVLNRLFYSVR